MEEDNKIHFNLEKNEVLYFTKWVKDNITSSLLAKLVMEEIEKAIFNEKNPTIEIHIWDIISVLGKQDKEFDILDDDLPF